MSRWPTLAVLLVLVAGTVVLTWPMAARLDSAAVDAGDPLLHAWILAWDARALARDPGRLFDANIYYPHRWTLAYSDHLLGLVPVAVPVLWGGGSPILAHNLLVLMTFPLAGLTMFWLVRHLTGRADAALLAGVLYAFSHVRFAQLAQVQMLAHGWLPLLLLALHRVAHRAGARDFALLAGAFVAQAMASGYCAWFAILAIGAFGAWLAAPSTRPPLGRLLRHGAVTAVAAALVLAPFSLPYLRAHGEVGLARSLFEVETFSARPGAYLTLPPTHPAFALLSAPFDRPEGRLFPGVLLLGLALVGAFTSRPPAPNPEIAPPSRWFAWLDPLVALGLGLTVLDVGLIGGVGYHVGPVRIGHRDLVWPAVAVVGVLAVRRVVHGRAVALRGFGWARRFAWPHGPGYYTVLALLAVVCSFGPTLWLAERRVARPLYRQLYDWLPGFDVLRVPARFGILLTTALAVLAGYGATALLRRCRDRHRRWLVGGLTALAMAEVWSVPLPFETVPAAGGPAERWLAGAPPGPVAILPFYPAEEAYREGRRLLASTAHWLPLVNGYSGVSPPGYWETAALLNRFPEPAALARLRQLGVRYVVAPESLARAAPAAAAVPVAVFDGSVVFEVRPEDPAARATGGR